MITVMPMEAEMGRRDNREAITRLFQGFINDFGDDAGGRIIRLMVDVLGGLRICVPSRPVSSESCRAIAECYLSLKDVFGDAGREIMRRFLMELKGMRLTFPSREDLYREERDERIRDLFNGSNIKELTIRFGLSETHVRRILNG